MRTYVIRYNLLSKPESRHLYGDKKTWLGHRDVTPISKVVVAKDIQSAKNTIRKYILENYTYDKCIFISYKQYSQGIVEI